MLFPQKKWNQLNHNPLNNSTKISANIKLKWNIFVIADEKKIFCALIKYPSLSYSYMNAMIYGKKSHRKHQEIIYENFHFLILFCPSFDLFPFFRHKIAICHSHLQLSHWSWFFSSTNIYLWNHRKEEEKNKNWMSQFNFINFHPNLKNIKIS